MVGGGRFLGALSPRGDKYSFPFLYETCGVMVQSTEMLLLGFENLNYYYIFFFTFPSSGSCVPKNQCHNFSLFFLSVVCFSFLVGFVFLFLLS